MLGDFLVPRSVFFHPLTHRNLNFIQQKSRVFFFCPHGPQISHLLSNQTCFWQSCSWRSNSWSFPCPRSNATQDNMATIRGCSKRSPGRLLRNRTHKKKNNGDWWRFHRQKWCCYSKKMIEKGPVLNLTPGFLTSISKCMALFYRLGIMKAEQPWPILL